MSNVSHRKSEAVSADACCSGRHTVTLAQVRAPYLRSLTTGPTESMKMAGASRRSAAPGNQSVGVAEYGDVLGTFVAPCSPRRSTEAHFCSRLTVVTPRSYVDAGATRMRRHAPTRKTRNWKRSLRTRRLRLRALRYPWVEFTHFFMRCEPSTANAPTPSPPSIARHSRNGG